MIFPERVIGKLGDTIIISGLQNPPISALTDALSSLMSSGDSSYQAVNMAKAQMDCPLISWGLPTTAACATAGWATKADSTSAVPIR